MLWLIPELLPLFTFQIGILLIFKCYALAAHHVSLFLSLTLAFVDADDTDEELKDAVNKELAQMILKLCELAPDERKLLFAELGDEADVIQKLLDEAE